MQVILVPTDFSANAKNAARYAIGLAADLQISRIVLYHAFQPISPVINEPMAPTIPVIDVDAMQEISINNLKQFSSEIQSFCPAGIQIEQLTEYAAVAVDIDNVCKRTGADLIIMGITGASKFEEILIGSTALSVVKNTKTPVIIVPAGATYTTIKNVMLACDFKKVAETIPVHAIKTLVSDTHATLHVLNVYENDSDINADKAQQKNLLNSLLSEYNPQFHFINNTDFIAGINQFADENSIDMIIAIPKKHGFLDGIFRERHTKKLAFHSHVPLMYVHQQDL